MYNPKIEVIDMGLDAYFIRIQDFENGALFTPAHFGIIISGLGHAVVFENLYTREQIKFQEQLKYLTAWGNPQSDFDVTYKKGKGPETHVGVWSRGKNSYKDFLTKPMITAIEALEKEYGTDWLTFT